MNNEECIHSIHNSWGSMYYHGYCAVCSYCLRTYTPKQAVEAIKENEARTTFKWEIDDVLINIFREKGLL